MLKRLLAYFDGRDAFCGVGFLLLFAGVAWRFGIDVALITTGAIILLKGLTRWV